jgi:dihydrodipicolinate synthase/N-acetylneuraminate lyase
VTTITLMPALVTPFATGGEIDLEAHRRNVERMAERGIRDLLIGGSTGEGSSLEAGERAALINTARAVLGGKGHLIAGIWAESVRIALAQIDESHEAGANAALVVTPTTLARTSLEAQHTYFSKVADNSPVAVMLYSVPRNTGYALAEEVVADLAQHANIVGMKDSGGDAVRIQRIIAATPDDFAVYNGATASLSLAVAAGAFGGITASANYAPEALIELIALARRSPSKAAGLQARLTGLSAVVEAPGIPGVKAASTVVGLEPGIPRLPLEPLGRSDHKRVTEAVRSI